MRDAELARIAFAITHIEFSRYQQFAKREKIAVDTEGQVRIDAELIAAPIRFVLDRVGRLQIVQRIDLAQKSARGDERVDDAGGRASSASRAYAYGPTKAESRTKERTRRCRWA